MKLWSGRFSSPMAIDADSFNESLSFDKKLFRADITASLAHAAMLGECNIISAEDSARICEGLQGILNDIQSGALEIKDAEDIHSFVENELVARIGEAGKMLHTARSRNDQVATDLRLYTRDSIDSVMKLLVLLIETLMQIAHDNVKSLMPGFTHLRKAQPVNVAQYFNAYSEMFMRDLERFSFCREHVNVMPLGSAALAGTPFPIDREFTRKKLGFAAISENALDAVSDRDFVAEYIFCASLTMAHLSRLCEDTILYTSDEFGYWGLPDEYCTGSSIMPQKKNPDIPELVRGKSGRVYGHLMAILTVLKGIPMAYNKDLQEDKEGLFDTEATLTSCLSIYTELLQHLTIRSDVCFEAAGEGYSTATDIADYLVRKGMPFRDAHALTGKIVRHCIQEKKKLTDLSLQDFQAFDPIFDRSILGVVTTRVSAESRNSVGGSSQTAVRRGLVSLRHRIKRY